MVLGTIVAVRVRVRKREDDIQSKDIKSKGDKHYKNKQKLKQWIKMGIKEHKIDFL